MIKTKIKELLLSTERTGIENLINHMEEFGFFDAPCSGAHHLAVRGGLAEHSLNVCETAFKLQDCFQSEEPKDSIIICALLHDIGKMGQFDKPNYVPNMLKGRATKANPNPEPYQSDKKPFITNPDLLYVDHEVRALSIISKYIDLTEEEQTAILWHNGLYGSFKYQIQGKETPLYMIIHFADMWASRVIEKGEDEDETTEL